MDHIHRFGPAILFATEAFESFNAIIRVKSVHSNCHAPSRDIGQAFAQGNRIRHLLSGGLFRLHTTPVTFTSVEASTPPFSNDPKSWTSIGPGPRGLVTFETTVTGYLGLSCLKVLAHGMRSSLSARVVLISLPQDFVFLMGKPLALFCIH